MTLQQLILYLQELEKEHGNIQVYISDGVNPYEVVKECITVSKTVFNYRVESDNCIVIEA